MLVEYVRPLLWIGVVLLREELWLLVIIIYYFYQFVILKVFNFDFLYFRNYARVDEI